jgi:hypothetical protein
MAFSGVTAGAFKGGSQLLSRQGVAYLRTDANGSKPYVGQAKSLARFAERQEEENRQYPNANFRFRQLGRADATKIANGIPTKLDMLEEDWIRMLGGPTPKSNPGGALANARHQVNEDTYRAYGGKY